MGLVLISVLAKSLAMTNIPIAPQDAFASSAQRPNQQEILTQERYFWSRDGVRLFVREYAGAPAAGQEGAPTLLCIPGLTRNSRDFEVLALMLAGRYRLWCVDLRGRGESGWAKDPLTYVPLTYLQDMERLVESFAPTSLALIGTSLGGIISMLMAGPLKDKFVGAVLNDIGPEIDPAGVARIRSYVGKTARFPTWVHAARAISEINGAAFPHYTLEDWLAMAKRVCRLEPSGRIVFDYDPRISEPFRLPGGEAGVDLWPAFAMLAGKPVLVVRGETSDILSAQTLEKMCAQGPNVHSVTVAGVGHAPTLTEPEALQGIERWLGELPNAL
jgi:pimeloyl-ACP methyl ester carboxylesterase